MPTRGHKETRKRTVLAEVERALLDALAESPAIQRSLWKLQREGWVLRLFLDCERVAADTAQDGARILPDPGSVAPARGAGEPDFRIDADDLRILRSLGIDPTRKRLPRRSR